MCLPCTGIREDLPQPSRGMPSEPSGGTALAKKVTDQAKAIAQHEVRFALALSLLGTVTISSVLVYLANCGNRHIEHCTWQVLSGTLSIFCALLILGAARRLCTLCVGHLKLAGHAQLLKLGFGFCAFITAVIIFQFLLWRYNTCDVQLTALGTLGAHIIGFVGNEVFGNFVRTPALASDPLHFVAGVAVVVLVYTGLGFLTHFARARFVSSRKDADADDIEHWLHQCTHAENEILGFTVGFLISMAVRFFIAGDAPPIHGNPHNKSKLQVEYFSRYQFAHICYSKFLQFCHVRFHGHLAHRIVDMVTEISSMTTGWLFLYSANWTFWNHDSLSGSSDASIEDVRSVCHMTASVLVAVFSSILAFMFILPLSLSIRLIGTRILGDLIGAAVLGVGFSWEVAFYHAIKSMSQEIRSHSREASEVFMVVLNLTLCALVLPAWQRNILPHAMEQKEAVKKLAHHSMMLQLHNSTGGEDYGHLPPEAQHALRQFREQHVHVRENLGTLQETNTSDDDEK
eukprot:CAMPEP_0179221112 /NCGR_PEP_ID=MMETSP0797-20121207/6008_1 /TAXON_ID=47934 /ORGANISM="Dinophysis acuminata, Strain DAEP01" /LENGTH=514 /DNA_ID=CAMNT_0020927855 /DNA_START=1 /DNA_END=1546 /DNA_ORIENTATION=-